MTWMSIEAGVLFEDVDIQAQGRLGLLLVAASAGLLKKLELSCHSGLTCTEQNEDAMQYHLEAQRLLSRQVHYPDSAPFTSS